MSSGRAAEWAKHFTDEKTKVNTQGERIFSPGLTWAEFVKLLDQTFDLRRTRDRARMDLAMLRMKSGELEQYILDFNLLASQGEFVMTGQENPCLPGMFLDGLNVRLQDKLKTRKMHLKP